MRLYVHSLYVDSVFTELFFLNFRDLRFNVQFNCKYLFKKKTTLYRSFFLRGQGGEGGNLAIRLYSMSHPTFINVYMLYN